MQSFARLVRACLGPDAVSERKLEHGNPLVVLGVETAIDEGGATFWPAQDKVDKWSASIDAFLASKVMRSGEASKLSGQLQWASQSAFRRLGRALLRPIIDQIYARSSAILYNLELSLRWWREVLALQIREQRAWSGNEGQQVHLFCDASSQPPHLGAVLFRCTRARSVALGARRIMYTCRDGEKFFCDSPAPEQIVSTLKTREDGQIMGLELLSIALGQLTCNSCGACNAAIRCV